MGVGVASAAEPAKPAAAADQTPATTQPAAGQDAPQGPAIERKGRKIVKHVTKNGKTLRGIVAADITKDQNDTAAMLANLLSLTGGGGGGGGGGRGRGAGA